MCGGRECVELFIVTHIDPNRESTFSLFFSLLAPSFAPSLLTLRGNHPFDDETHFMKIRTKRTWVVMSRYSHVRNSAASSFRISRTRAPLLQICYFDSTSPCFSARFLRFYCNKYLLPRFFFVLFRPQREEYIMRIFADKT